MTQWWSDPERASAALSVVDDSDVVQGVSTAVLGYHGLSEAVLRPLASRTLLDGQQVAEALEGVDLAPVAKALGNATRPVMGDDADAYGMLLARQLHEDAVDSTTRFVTNLVSTGVPWPMAVERAASVHGVPVTRLGRAASVLRAPVVAKAAQADAADRALVEFAAHVGLREDTRSAVSKMERERFREEDVNRDALGRFADKPGGLAGMKRQATDSERAARRERTLKRRQKRQGQLKKLESRRKSLSLSDLKREVEVPSPVAQANERPKTDTASVDAKRAAIRAAVRDEVRAQVRKEALKKAIADMKRMKETPPEPDGVTALLGVREGVSKPYKGVVMGSRAEQKYILLNNHLYSQIVEAEGFNWYKLMQSGATLGDQVMDKDGLLFQMAGLAQVPDNDLEDYSILVLDGPLAYREDVVEGKDDYLADEGNYRVQVSDYDIGNYLDLEIMVAESPGSSKKVNIASEMPFIMVSLDSEYEDFEHNFAKAWHEYSVHRDELGRFAEKPASAPAKLDERAMRSPEDRKAARDRTRARRMKRLQQLQQLQAQQKRSIGLGDLTRIQEPMEQPQAQRPVTNEQAAVNVRDQVRSEVRNQIRAQIKAEVLAQAIEQQKAKTASLAEARLRFHDDLSHTEAVVFNPEEDHQTLAGLFGYDPYEKKMDDSLKFDPSDRSAVFEYGKKVRSTSAVVDGLHMMAISNQQNGGRRLWDDDPMPVVDMQGNPMRFSSQGDAMMVAQTEAENLNRQYDSKTSRFVGFAKAIREPGGYPSYEPYTVPVWVEETDIVVLGSKDDWAAVKAGKDATLEPVYGFDDSPEDPGLGTFDQLFGLAGTDEEWAKQLETPTRSDFYVRAFRIKR